MSLLLTLSTTALFERRESSLSLSTRALAGLLESGGWRVVVEPPISDGLEGLYVYQQGGTYETTVSVHEAGALSWKGGASRELEELLVGWFFDLVAGREDVWLYSDSGDLILRLSPSTYLEDLARIRDGLRERRDIPPGLDLG